MAFKAIGSLNPHGSVVLRRQILGNSITVTELDSIKLASGFAVLGTTATLVFGHAVSLSANKGVGLLTTGVAGASIGSFVGTFLTAANNQTVGFVKADIDVSKFTLYSAQESAAIGTTAGSNLAGYVQDLSTEKILSEASAAAPSTVTTTFKQYMGWGVDPSNSAQAVVNIYQSQVFGV